MKSDLIYVIDDDKANNFLCKVMFDDVGLHNLKQFYKVDPALEELKKVCTEKLEEEFPRLILLDINMPVKDGWEFLAELRLLNCNFENQPKIFMISSSDHQRDKDKATGFPEVLEFLPKPLTLEDATRLRDTYFAA